YLRSLPLLAINKLGYNTFYHIITTSRESIFGQLMCRKYFSLAIHHNTREATSRGRLYSWISFDQIFSIRELGISYLPKLVHEWSQDQTDKKMWLVEITSRVFKKHHRKKYSCIGKIVRAVPEQVFCGNLMPCSITIETNPENSAQLSFKSAG